MNASTLFRRQQWKMLLATMFCYLFFYTGRHNFGWAVNGMSADLSVSYTTIGWISFSMLIGYAVGQLINGNLADQFGARNMILTGAILSVLANIAISFANSVIPVFILWALNGYFQSMAWAPGGRIITNWWGKEQRGRAFGFYTMAAGSSSILTYFVCMQILQYNLSWRYLFSLPVLLLLIGVFIFYALVRNKPSDKGFESSPDQATADSELTWKQRYCAVFSNRKFLIASLAIGFQSMARYGLIFWLPVHILSEDEKNSSSYIWISFMMPVGMAIGAYCFGWISDTIFKGNRPLSIIMGMVLSAFVSVLIFFSNYDYIIWDAFLLFCAGFFVYGVQANFWPMSPEMLGEKFVGTGIGIMNMSAYLFAAIGEPVLGKIIDITGDTSYVFIAVAAISLLCAAIISFCRNPQKWIQPSVNV